MQTAFLRDQTCNATYGVPGMLYWTKGCHFKHTGKVLAQGCNLTLSFRNQTSNAVTSPFSRCNIFIASNGAAQQNTIMQAHQVACDTHGGRTSPISALSAGEAKLMKESDLIQAPLSEQTQSNCKAWLNDFNLAYA